MIDFRNEMGTRMKGRLYLRLVMDAGTECVVSVWNIMNRTTLVKIYTLLVWLFFTLFILGRNANIMTERILK